MPKSKPKIEHIRHSMAHILAMAVLEKWPGTKLGIGPVLDFGCYYDFELPVEISQKDIPDIEERMRKIISRNLNFEGMQVSFEEAIKFFKERGQIYKLDLINDLQFYGTTAVHGHEKNLKPKNKVSKLKNVSLYKTGDFVDLCRGGHVKNTKELNPDAFRIIKISGAYWRGSENNPMLTRIYLAVFRTKKELDKYIAKQEEALKRDHRRIGEALDLFIFSPLVGSGLPIYTPKGTILRKLIQEYVAELQKQAGYEEVQTPQITKAELFKISGHYEKFKNDMFRVYSNYSDEEMFLKPMNCPFHTQIFASRPRSWRDLPIRYADFSMLYRDEKPGELLGLSRTRAFSQDDAHIFCREDQIEDEFERALNLIEKVLKTYGLNYWVRLSLRDPKHPENYIGEKTIWDKAEKMLSEILKRKNIKFKKIKGEAAFYGPKMDIIVKDSLERDWQVSTIQLDFQMPLRFGLTYTDKDGTKKAPVMIHRAINGSAERFLALLIEHYGGAFPLWLSPVQVAIIPVSEKFNSYGKKIYKKLLESGIRVELWDKNESVGKRIRDGEMQKIPYLLVVGEKEKKQNTVSVRERYKGDIGNQNFDKFISDILRKISLKK